MKCLAVERIFAGASVGVVRFGGCRIFTHGVWRPLHGGCVPGVEGGCRWRAEGDPEVEEEGNLGEGEENGGERDVALQWHGRGEELAGRTGDACELRVLAGLSSEARDVHGEKGRVGEEDRQPEADFAEGFAERAARDRRKPVVMAR